MRWGGQRQGRRRTEDRSLLTDFVCFLWLVILVIAAAAVQ